MPQTQSRLNEPLEDNGTKIGRNNNFNGENHVAIGNYNNLNSEENLILGDFNSAAGKAFILGDQNITSDSKNPIFVIGNNNTTPPNSNGIIAGHYMTFSQIFDNGYVFGADGLYQTYSINDFMIFGQPTATQSFTHSQRVYINWDVEFGPDSNVFGLTGSLIGAAGPQGFQGPFGGPQGFVGATGPQGNTGSIGNTGAQGHFGPTGSQGFQGNTGPQGLIGNTGAQGLIGPTGFGGAIGSYGSFYSTSGFTSSLHNIEYPFTLLSNGVVTDGVDKIIFNNSGVYNIDFSANVGLSYIDSTSTSNNIGIYLSKNGVSLTWSAISISKALGWSIPPAPNWQIVDSFNINNNWQLEVSTGDYVQVQFVLIGTGQLGAATLGTFSFVPSSVINVNQVMYTQIGNTGSQGIFGPTGSNGVQGNTGPQGLIGNTGSSGLNGNTGSQGFQGPIGLTGAQGDFGPTGFQGNTGPQGLVGNTGSTGSNGIDGNTGPQGPIGLTGNQGPIGPTGVGGALGYYGSFYSNLDVQYFTESNYVRYENTRYSNGITTDGVDKIFTSVGGVYSIDVMFNYSKLSVPSVVISNRNITYYISKNNTEILHTGVFNEGDNISNVNFLLETNDGDYLQVGFYGWTSSLPPNVGIPVIKGATASFAQFGSGIPIDIPASILNIHQVMYTQLGATGSNGATGSQGFQGPIGLTGSQGQFGPTGFQGNTGPQGISGTIGVDGNTGPQGFQGNIGPSGSNGSQGFQGPQGLTGPQGALSSDKGSIGVIFDGFGGVPIVGKTDWIVVPYNGTITGWQIFGGTTGSCVIDVRKDTYGNFPPTAADSIAGTEKPTLISQIKNEDLSLSSWTSSVTSGDIIQFYLESASLLTKINCVIFIDKN